MKVHMKNLLLAVLAIVLVSCSDDKESIPANRFEYDGKTVGIQEAYIDEDSREAGNFDFTFLTKKKGITHKILIQLSGAWDGTEVDLTQVDNQYDWSWFVSYYTSSKGKEDDSKVYAFGQYESYFREVIKSGTLKITQLSENPDTYEILVDLETTEDKKFKVIYNGSLLPEGEDDDR